MPEILVTIPAYNEEGTIAKVIEDINHELTNSPWSFAIMVVSDGSEDNTVRLAKDAGAMVYEKEHSGLAETFRYEMGVALRDFDPDVIIHMDADGQYIAKDIPRLIRELRVYSGLVLGNRLDGDLEYMPFSKKLFNRLGSAFFSLMLRKWIPDITTGLRAFTKEVAGLSIYSDYTYTVEQVIRVSQRKLPISSVPVTFRARSDESRLMHSPVDYIANTAKNLRRAFRQ